MTTMRERGLRLLDRLCRPHRPGAPCRICGRYVRWGRGIWDARVCSGECWLAHRARWDRAVTGGTDDG